MEKEKEKKDKSKTYIPSSLTSPILWVWIHQKNKVILLQKFFLVIGRRFR
jgi:hypothetical protein